MKEGNTVKHKVIGLEGKVVKIERGKIWVREKDSGGMFVIKNKEDYDII